MQPAAVLSAGVASVVFPPNLPLPESIWLHMEGIGAALLLLYCCFTAALLLLYCSSDYCMGAHIQVPLKCASIPTRA
jgi:hypothetical protein